MMRPWWVLSNCRDAGMRHGAKALQVSHAIQNALATSEGLAHGWRARPPTATAESACFSLGGRSQSTNACLVTASASRQE